MSMILQADPAPGRATPADIEPIRLAIVGLGNRATWAIETCGQGASALRVAALVDPAESRRTVIRNEYGLAGVSEFASLQECLSRGEVDAVAIFTPDAMHAELAVEALEAGKHVFLEKPLEITRERMRRIIEADDRAGGRTFVGLNLRFAPVYRRIHELIEAGELGRILTVQADEFYDGGRTYFRRWNRRREHSGGLWITKACHDFDLIQWLVPSRPVSVSAASALTYYVPRPDAAMHCRDCPLAPTCGDRYDLFVEPGSLRHRMNQAHEAQTGERPDLCLFNSDKDTFDHGTALIRFECGATATYTLNVVAPFTNRRIRVGGTRATVDGDHEAMTVTVYPRDGATPRTEDLRAQGAGSHGGADGHLLQAFAGFVRGEPVNVIRPREAAVGVLLGLAAERATQTGLAEPLEPLG